MIYFGDDFYDEDEDLEDDEDFYEPQCPYCGCYSHEEHAPSCPMTDRPIFDEEDDFDTDADPGDED